MATEVSGADRRTTREIPRPLKRLGVREVVWPEMEAGLEILRHTLRARHTRRSEVDSLVQQLREALAFGPGEPAEPRPPQGLGAAPQDREKPPADD